MEIKIRKARPDEVAEITALSIRSKRSNGYDEAFMAACREELTVTEDDLADGEYWVAESAVLCGCACLAIDPVARVGEVHSFFINPNWQRLEIGRLLWRKLAERAEAAGLTHLHLDADPFAVPFYEAIGFAVTGEVASGSIPGRRLPRMTLVLGRSTSRSGGTLGGG